jgi:hypothetical protein
MVENESVWFVTGVCAVSETERLVVLDEMAVLALTNWDSVEKAAVETVLRDACRRSMKRVLLMAW